MIEAKIVAPQSTRPWQSLARIIARATFVAGSNTVKPSQVKM